jgi:hypothetical protein
MTYEFFKELDAAARANLNDRGVRAYEEWKAHLLTNYEDRTDVEDILRGFIWDSSEAGHDYAKP